MFPYEGPSAASTLIVSLFVMKIVFLQSDASFRRSASLVWRDKLFSAGASNPKPSLKFMSMPSGWPKL